MKLRLIYARENVGEPVLSNVVLRTGVPLNILEARMEPDMGEIVVDAPAKGEQLRKVINLFREAGVSVKEITATIEIDEERCISCGACISPCPVQAIRFGPEWKVEFDEERCLRCQVCINACPVGAIRSL